MRYTLFICLSIFSIALFGYRSKPASDFRVKGQHFFQYDTNSVKLAGFRVFAREFFVAVNRADSHFLAAHVIFPISNSSFDIFDENAGQKPIDSKMFFKKLHQLFPGNLIKRISKEGKFAFSEPKNKPKKFIIELYDNSSGIEGNYTWVFIQKGDQFYFTNFRSEAG
jgi:hypothetical protein